MSVKSVTMDPKLLSLGGGNRGKTSRKSDWKNSTRKMSKVKQELIKRIKSHESANKSSSDDTQSDVKKIVSDDSDSHFMDSLNHLNDVIHNLRDSLTRFVQTDQFRLAK